MERIAIDVGSGVTKICSDQRRTHFPSLSGVPEEGGFELKEAPGANVAFGRKKYVVGERASKLVHPDKLANTRDDRWFETDAYMALLYAAMAKSLPDEYNGKVALCTGLPQALYIGCKADLVKRLARKHQFTVEGKKYTVHIRVDDLQVMPQVMGLFLSRLALDKSLQVQTVGLIDVGTYTSDWTIVSDCSTEHWAAGGIAVGVADVILTLSNYMKRDFNMHCTEAAMTRALRTRKILVGDHEVDLTGRIDQAVMGCAKKMVDEVNKQWRGGKDTPIIVGGGGAALFAPQIGLSFPHARVIEDREPIYSIVDGYYTYMKQRAQQLAA
jgi:PRTRC genetic system protein D